MSELQVWVWWKQPNMCVGGKTYRTCEMKQTFGARSHVGWNKRNKYKTSFSKSIFMLLVLYIIFSLLFLLFSKVYLGSQTVVRDISISARPVVKDDGGTPRGLDSGKN